LSLFTLYEKLLQFTTVYKHGVCHIVTAIISRQSTTMIHDDLLAFVCLSVMFTIFQKRVGGSETNMTMMTCQ